MRILHTPRNPAGIATGLAEGERRLGHTAEVLTLYRHYTEYPGEKCLEVGPCIELTGDYEADLERIKPFYSRYEDRYPDHFAL